MIVRVYVANAVLANEKPYDYQVPPVFASMVQVGSRVTVPYGRGNRPREAIVVEILEESGQKKLKSITSVVDFPPLSPQMLKLAEFVKSRCFCTYYDAVRLMLPPNTAVHFKEEYALADGGERNDLTPEQRQFLQKIQDAPQPLALRDVTEEERKIGDSLCKKGVLYVVRDGTQHQNILRKKCAKLTERKKAEEYLEKLPLSRKGQRQVLELLLQHGTTGVKELCYEAGCTSSVANTLKQKGIITYVEEEQSRDPYANLEEGDGHGQDLTLTQEQQEAYHQLEERMEQQKASCVLLKGVTGSGKTVVFIKAIAKALAQGRTALLLVPEISLTPQMVRIFYQQFGSKVAVLHSRMSTGQRNDAYRQILRGEKPIVIGTRLSVFAPLENIGVIIMDEEQETTYKSEQNPRYDAKEVAKFRCVQQGALLVLASATPSVESYYLAKEGVYHLVELSARYNGGELPRVEIVDMAAELKGGNHSMFSARLAQELSENLKRGEQSILFLNRRGYSGFVSCRECGYVATCPNCSISLTYHSKNNKLMCHYCGHVQDAMTTCPNCGSPYIRMMGTGTQRVEQELQRLLPGARILRMDTDTTAQKDGHQAILDAFRQKKGDILLGTQMVVKGLDFENVTFVGVLSADMSLYVEDFRAAQNTFNLITQVVGRSGRGSKQGRALIQTYTPNHPVIQRAARQDYEGFYAQEIALRRQMNYPPFCDLWVVHVSAQQEEQAAACMEGVAKGLVKALQGEEVSIIGPGPCHMVRRNKTYHYRLILKYIKAKRMRRIMDNLLKTFYNKKEYQDITLSVDVNPYSFL